LQAFSFHLMLQTVLDCQGDLGGMCCSYEAVARGGNRESEVDVAEGFYCVIECSGVKESFMVCIFF